MIKSTKERQRIDENTWKVGERITLHYKAMKVAGIVSDEIHLMENREAEGEMSAILREEKRKLQRKMTREMVTVLTNEHSPGFITHDAPGMLVAGKKRPISASCLTYRSFYFKNSP